MKQHTKTLGQVFLHDQNIINKIITLASPEPDYPIIEIGCGKGILTQALTEIAPVNVIEIDERWINHVSDLNLKNVTFTHIDALKVDYSTFPKGTPIIANIPYQITSPLIELFTQYNHHLGPITIMIQKEMAERLVATPNSKRYGSMTIFCNYYFDVNKGFGVSRNCFTPPPNVDSQVIQLTTKAPLLPANDEPLFFAMTRTLFWGRRKTIIKCLKTGPYLFLQDGYPDRPEFKHRGESLSLNELKGLFDALQPYLKLRPNS